MHSEIDLTLQRIVVLNKINDIKSEIESLKKNNPWHPTYKLSGILSGYSKRLKRINAEIKAAKVGVENVQVRWQ